MISFSSWLKRRRVSIVIILVVLPILAGCSSLKSGSDRVMATGMEPGEMIAIVPNYVGDMDDVFESSLAICIQEAIKSTVSGSRFMFYHDFQAAVFGDLKQPERPLCDDIAKLALADSRIRSLLDPLDIRYLVCISGTSYSKPPEALGGGAPGGAVLLISWHKSSSASARVYDLKSMFYAGSLSASAEDTGVVSLMPPLFIPAMTETKTCKRLGKEVAQFLISKEQPISVPQGL